MNAVHPCPPLSLCVYALALLAPATVQSDYIGSASTVGANSSIQSAAMEILGSGGGSGAFAYKGGGNAVDAAVAAALAACVVNPGNASLGGYGGHMIIYKSGWAGEAPLVTCIDFNSAAGSLARSDTFAGSVDAMTGKWIAAGQPANQYGWKAVGVPGTLAGLFMAQTNYGRRSDGTNLLPFAEILKPALARIANGQAAGTAYYTLTSVSNLLMDLYTNSPGYLDGNGNPNPSSSNNPCAVFYSGDIARDIAAAMEANGGLVTYADMATYRPREVAPYLRHFNPPGGTPAWVCVAPLGSSGLSVLQQLVTIEALGWTNGPAGTWDSLRYWHSRAEASRLMWKDYFQWLGDPWSGVLPPDFLGNGSQDFCEQMLAHVTHGYSSGCPWDTTEVPLTNSLAGSVIQAVNGQTNIPVLVHWDDIRYGTRNISTSDKWGNCVALTFSMGGGFGAQVAVTNRGLVLGQGMALFDARPGWPDSIAPGKRPVNNMSPAIVIPDVPGSPTNGIAGRPPLAVGGVGGSTIENNMAMELAKYLTESPASSVSEPAVWLYNFEANKTIYMRPSYPSGLQSYLTTVGFTALGAPPSAGEISRVEAWIPPVILRQPASTNVVGGSTVAFEVTATGLPLFYQWVRNGAALSDGPGISGTKTRRLTIASVTSGGAYSVVITNGAGPVTSAPAVLVVDGVPVIVASPASRTNMPGTLATFSIITTGAPPLFYRWTKNGIRLSDGGNVSGASTNTLNLASVSLADAGNYAVIVTNFAGAVTSAPAILSIVSSSSGDLFLYEPFDYSNVGGPVSSNTPMNWTYNGSGANDLNVTAGGLEWPGLAVSIGNSVTNGGNGLGVRRLFGTNISSGQIYFSALFRINDLGFGAWNGLASQVGALTATDNTSFRLQILVKSNSPNGYIIGVQKGGTGVTAIFDNTERHAGETMFLVGKYNFATTPNSVTLWINPGADRFGAATEPDTGLISATSGTDGLTIDRFNMRQNAASGSASVPAAMQWDELRFGLTWSAVTPPASPQNVRLMNPTVSGMGAFQFSYTNRSAQSYAVFASTNFLEWRSIGVATQVSSGLFEFTDGQATNLSRRFYELRSP